MGNKNPYWNILQNEIITPYSGRIADKIPNYMENHPSEQKIAKNGKPRTDVSKLLDSLEV